MIENTNQQHCFFEVLLRQRQALNLRVVKENGQRISGKEAFVRRMFDLVDFWLFFGIPALISMNVTEKNQRIGDFCAGTIVIDLADEAQLASIH